MKKLLPILLILGLLCSACTAPGAGNYTPSEAPGTVSDSGTADDSGNAGSATGTPDIAQGDSDMFTDRDGRSEYDETKSVRIRLDGDAISCDSKSVQVSGSQAVITGEGTYILSGTLNDGMIVVNAGDKDKLQLVLEGVSITSAASAPIYILNADKVFLTLADGTSNTLSNGGTFTAVDENNIDAVIFSKEDLTLNGSGSLTVNSPAGHGIVSKDDLVITGGRYTITSASHGLEANDSVRLTGAALAIAAGKDGIHAENSDDDSLGFVYIAGGTFDISAEGDGVSAGSYLRIEDGSFDIVTGGGSANASKQTSDTWGNYGGRGGFGGPGGGMGGPSGGFGGPGGPGGSISSTETDSDSSTSIKGLKASGELLINGGTFTIDSADDAVHSNGDLTVNGGTFTIATGDDGFHADESLTINGGTIHITESYEGIEGLHVLISGGNIKLAATDDGINAAGGTDSSGFGGSRGGDRFGGRGGMGGGGASNGTIVISGGNIYVKAYGDGLDANGTLTISGGYTVVCGPTQGDTATLDYDVSGVITGGTFIGTGASGMAQTFSDSEQGVVAVRAGNQQAGTRITLTDGAGNTLFDCAPELDFAVVILSSPDLVKGETYTITVGSDSGEVTAS